MTTNAIVQLVLYVVVLLVAGQAARRLHGAGLPGRRVGARAWPRLARAADLPRGRGSRPARRWGGRRTRWRCSLFNLVGLFAVYLLQRLQGVLPLNPQGMAAVSPDSSFNTAVSFATNTNWQGYGGESTMSYLTQMLGADGAELRLGRHRAWPSLVALIRGFARRSAETIGNFWVDLTRTHALHPAAAVARSSRSSWCRRAWCRPSALPDGRARAADPVRRAGDGQGRQAGPRRQGQARRRRSRPLTEQVLAVGPAASQIAIKQLGTNGGGFFNVNSAHPFENPTPLSNFLEMLVDPADLRRRSATRSASWSATRARAGRSWPR